MSQNNINLKKLTFAHSLKPIYILSRIFGFMPFSIIFESNGAIQTARIRKIDFLWFITSIGIYLLSAYYFLIYSMRKPIPNGRATLSYGTRSIVIFRKCLNCLNIGIDMYNRFRLVEILKRINSFDEKASKC